jgi:TatD DNase family protein
MKLVDTHTHLYLNAFDEDREESLQRAIAAGVEAFLLPNIDSGSIEAMKALAQTWPQHCFPMMGLHPTSVKENWEEELAVVREELDKGRYAAVGEIGIDLYWDQSFRDIQIEVFRLQAQWAAAKQLPVSIHCRESMDLVLDTLETLALPSLQGVFHCFTGDVPQAARILEMGFFLGIGGVFTFKNSDLRAVLKSLGPQALVLETDAPFLAPVPYRGKRNEPAYIPIIVRHIADTLGYEAEEIAEITTANALKVYPSINANNTF